MRKISHLKCGAFFAVTISLGLLTFIPMGYSQSAQKIKAQDEIMRHHMIDISRELRVTCTECHRVDNFKDDRKTSFKIAKEHIQTVELLRNHGFDGKKAPLANCYMCHRGELKPAYNEKLKVVPVVKKEPAQPQAE